MECSNRLPADSYGIGIYCDELQEIISRVDEDIAIPDHCPKLEKKILFSNMNGQKVPENNFREWVDKYYPHINDPEELTQMSHAYASGHMNMASKYSGLKSKYDETVRLLEKVYNITQNE